MSKGQNDLYWRIGLVAFFLCLTAGTASHAKEPEWARGCRGYVPPPHIPGFPDEPPDMAPGHLGKPMSYKDSLTGTIFYVESDGRHLAAIDPNGKLLWVEDPFADLNLCSYRNLRPTIVYVGPPHGGMLDREDDQAATKADAALSKLLKRQAHYIEIKFDSSQFIYVDVENGVSFFGGNN